MGVPALLDSQKARVFGENQGAVSFKGPKVFWLKRKLKEIEMLRQRGPEKECNDEMEVFIGDAVPNHTNATHVFAKEDENEPSWWPTVTKLLFVIAVVSVLVVVYQSWELSSCHRSLSQLGVEAASKASEWEADKHSVEECREEIGRMEVLQLLSD